MIRRTRLSSGKEGERERPKRKERKNLPTHVMTTEAFRTQIKIIHISTTALFVNRLTIEIDLQNNPATYTNPKLIPQGYRCVAIFRSHFLFATKNHR
jgi:hypothetical protein